MISRLRGRVSPWFVVFVAALGVALLSLFVPADDPFPGREPGVMRPEDMIVAVLDCGVDATHKDLKDSVLKGWNVLDGSDDTQDKLGHGTAVAGLIAAHGEGNDALKGLAPGVRILPVKVVNDGSADTVAPMLTIGIEYALKNKAKIICIPLGAPRGTASLQSALDDCRKQGVLVIAAAGIASGTQDYWPAAHPWAVSCTCSSETVIPDKDGKPGLTVSAIATRANLTAKTELAGNPSAQSTRPGDTYGPLEGTSSVTARAAGVAARIWLVDPKLTAEEVRRILVDSGPRIGTPNFQNVYRATVLDLDSALASVDAGKSDLALRSAILRPYPWHPGEKRLAEAVVTNCGRKKVGGKLAVDIDKKYAFDIAELEPGETKRIEFEIPPTAKLEGGRARIAIEEVSGEGNTANNVLNISIAERPREGPSVMIQSAGIDDFGIAPGQAKAWAIIRNLETAEELPAEVQLKTSNAKWSRPIRIPAGAEVRVDADWTVPSGSSDVLEVTVEVKGKQTDSVRAGVCLEDSPVTMQYADVWDRDEIIFDMPWAVIEGRSEIPLLVFVPETKNVGMAIDGVFLKDIKVWNSDPATIHGFVPSRDYWGENETPIYGASADLISCAGPGHCEATGGVWERFRGIPVESETGQLIREQTLAGTRPIGVVGYIDYPCWHRIIRLPIASPVPDMYFTARAVTSYFRFRPPSETTGFPSIDQDEITIKVMRVQQKKPMPMLSKEGKYWDTHVHTAAEYSTLIADPRLAWGGPPRMLVWTAYSLGMLDSHEPGTFMDKIITTDHNCFFSDMDVPKFPPFSQCTGDMEYLTLREMIGERTGGQEVSMYRAHSPAATPHALVYEHHSHFPGPWFGDRSQADFLKAFLPYLDDAIYLIGLGIKNGTLHGKALELGLDLAKDTWVDGGGEEAWKKVEAEIRTTQSEGKLSTGCKLKSAAKLALCLSDEQLKFMKHELDLALKNAQIMQIPNTNSQIHVMEAMKTSQAHAYAAHPVNPSYAWNDREIHEWLNFAPDSRKLTMTRDEQFMTSGLQIWNDPKKMCAHLPASENLFFLNPWSFTWILQREWHHELSAGFELFGQLTREGMQYSFDDDPERGTFIRKLFISAGSDAHGDFNYATGVTASITSHHGLEPFMMLFGSGAGAEAYDAAYAKCRTYALGGTLDDFYHGRTTLTDGPLIDFRVDSDLRFEIGPAQGGNPAERSWLWHDKWESAEQGKDVDGQIGGDGKFDGARTAAIRKGCPHIVANLNSKTAETWGGDLSDVDAYWWDREQAPQFAVRLKVNELAANQDVGKFEGSKAVRLKLAPTCTGAILFGGFASRLRRYHPDWNQCFTNPVWYTTIDILPSAEVTKRGDRAWILPKNLVVHFRTDISMKAGMTSRVFIQQLDSNGDSFGPRIPLLPLGPWHDLKDPKDDGKTVMKRCLMEAVNPEAIEVAAPWYPADGVASWCVVLADVIDTNGNRLNEVATTFAASVPADSGPVKDEGNPGDGGDIPNDPKDAETGHGGNANTPTETACVRVNPGETIELPRGGTVDGRKVASGNFGVPDPFPVGGMLVGVACSTGETVLIRLATSRAGPTADMKRQGETWVAEAPKNPGKVTSLSFKNHDDKTVTVGEALVVSDSCVAFAAPDADPGQGDVLVTQEGKTASYPVEAVAPKIVWDCADAKVGDVRVLSVVLAGASKPGDWLISGEISVQNGKLLSRAPGVTGDGAGLKLSKFSGAAGELARFEALLPGKMTAAARLKAVRK